MKKTIGIILIVLGVAAFLVETIGITTEETVIDAGPIEVTRDDEKSVSIPVVGGIIAIVAGVALLAWGSKTGD